MKKVSLVVLLLALVSVPALYADTVVYNNGGPNQLDGRNLSDRILAEDFTLTKDTKITDIHFWDLELRGGYSGAISWWITGDTNGFPDPTNILASGVVDPTRTLTGFGCADYGDGYIYCEYENSWYIDALNLAPGTYHLALYNGNTNDDPWDGDFEWETTDANGTPTATRCWINLDCRDVNNWQHIPKEFAYNLTGNPVPEPSSLLMLGTGALGVFGSLRKRFQK